MPTEAGETARARRCWVAVSIDIDEGSLRCGWVGERESVGAMPSSCHVTILCDVFLSQSGPFAKGRIVTSVCRRADRQTVNV